MTRSRWERLARGWARMIAAPLIAAGLVACNQGPPRLRIRGVPWRSGHEYSYRFSWQNESRAQLVASSSGDALSTQLELRAVLTLRPHAQADDGTVVTASFREIERASLRALGNELFTTPDLARAELATSVAYWRLARDGSEQDLRFPVDAPPLFRSLMRGVLRELGSQQL
ncbi:MAG TPA: hypothetical protein VG963_26140, partial [Polyangiaceae bacterium]|nr:hypothetical protein [Polyangiaceae bacterium]